MGLGVEGPRLGMAAPGYPIPRWAQRGLLGLGKKPISRRFLLAAKAPLAEAIISGVMLRALRSRIRLPLACAAIGMAAAAGLEVAAHRLVPEAWNLRGYRGRRLGAKAPGELRVATLGDSMTWGYGVRTGQAYPAVLEAALRDAVAGAYPVSVANLGFNDDGAVCFAPTLQAYAGLDPDVVILYAGREDAPRTTLDCGRFASPVFRATGLLPLSPLVAREWYYAWRFGSAARGYEQERRRSPAAAAAGSSRHVRLVIDVITSLVAAGRGAVLGTEPSFGRADPQCRDRHAELRLQAERLGSPMLRWVDSDALFGPGERDAMTLDGTHLTASGNARLAGAFVPAVLELAVRLGHPVAR